MVPKHLLSLLRCPTCRATDMLYRDESGLHCAKCKHVYPIHNAYIDLMPRGPSYDYVSKYVSEEAELAEELDYRDMAPPLLAAGVRNRMLVDLLELKPSDIALDNGCGTAKFAVWNAGKVGMMIGSDPATLFAEEAEQRVALVQGDSRDLPFADNMIDKAFSVDVLEHFPMPVIHGYLEEMARVLKPGGKFLIFSNTREPSALQPLIDLSRKLGKLFVRAGVYDFEREARRKSDHVKALENWEQVLIAVQAAGLRPVKAVFWNSLFTTFVEHVVMKLGEAVIGVARQGKKRKSAPSSEQSSNDGHYTPTDGAQREIRARRRMRGWLQSKGVIYYALSAITWLMERDVRWFGRLRSGTYFLVVEKA